MSDDAPRIDTRTPEEIATAQRGLLKILAIATFFPVVWVTIMAWGIVQGMDQVNPDEQSFGNVAMVWGMLSPVVWLGSYGYTLYHINRGNMDAGRYLPLLPAFWVILWFAALFAR